MGLTTRQSSDQFGADQAASEPLRRATGRATTCGRQRGGVPAAPAGRWNGAAERALSRRERIGRGKAARSWTATAPGRCCGGVDEDAIALAATGI